MKKVLKNKKGFTLVELIVVIAILAILAGVATGVTLGVLDNSRKSALKTSAEAVVGIIKQINADPTSYTVKSGTSTQKVSSATLVSALVPTIAANVDKVKDSGDTANTTDTIVLSTSSTAKFMSASDSAKITFTLTDTANGLKVDITWNGKTGVVGDVVKS